MAEWGLEAIIDTPPPKEYDQQHNDYYGSFGSIDIKKEYDQALLFCFPHLTYNHEHQHEHEHDHHATTSSSSNTLHVTHDDLDQLYKPPAAATAFYPVPPPPAASSDHDHTHLQIIHNHNYLDHSINDQQEIIQQDNQQQQIINMSSSTSKTSTQPAISKLKKRKNQQKRVVVQVTAAGLSSDPWAWRKYGQKPIKGSIYPRSYYRCSSSKGCMARRQVEQSCTDSTIYILTYTAEHNHPQPTRRNSLAGINRNRFKHTPKHTTTTITTADMCDVNAASKTTVTKSPFHSPTTTTVSGSSSFEDDHQVLQQSNIKEETMFYNKCDDSNNQGYSMMMPEINDEDYMVFSDDWFEGLEDLGGSYNKAESSSSSYDYSSTKQFPHVFC